MRGSAPRKKQKRISLQRPRKDVMNHPKRDGRTHKCGETVPRFTAARLPSRACPCATRQDLEGGAGFEPATALGGSRGHTGLLTLFSYPPTGKRARPVQGGWQTPAGSGCCFGADMLENVKSPRGLRLHAANRTGTIRRARGWHEALPGRLKKYPPDPLGGLRTGRGRKTRTAEMRETGPS